jgi:hypothetical protein
MAWARRVDTVQSDIVVDLRKLGASVLDLSRVGVGCPDLLVGWKGINLLVELKTPKRGTKKATAEKQAVFAATWSGAPVLKATSLQQILDRFAQLEAA